MTDQDKTPEELSEEFDDILHGDGVSAHPEESTSVEYDWQVTPRHRKKH